MFLVCLYFPLKNLPFFQVCPKKKKKRNVELFALQIDLQMACGRLHSGLPLMLEFQQ